MQTFAALALQEDTLVPEELGDQAVHVRLRECTPVLFRSTLCVYLGKRRRTSDFLIQEITEINGTAFAAQEAFGDALALDVLACILGRVPFAGRLSSPVTRVQCAVKALLLVNPELKITFPSLGIATKRRLGQLFLQLVPNLLVGDVADLVILVHDHAILETPRLIFLFVGHEWPTRSVGSTDVTVDALPARIALAMLSSSREAISTVGERAAEGLTAVLATEA